MLFPLSNEGVAGLRNLAAEMHQCSDALSQEAMILNSEALAFAPMLGNYAALISNLVDDVLSELTEIKNAITVLGENLLVKAQKMENILEAVNSEGFNPARAALATGIVTAGIALNTMFPKFETESTQNLISPLTPAHVIVHNLFEAGENYYEMMENKKKTSELQLLQSDEQI